MAQGWGERGRGITQNKGPMEGGAKHEHGSGNTPPPRAFLHVKLHYYFFNKNCDTQWVPAKVRTFSKMDIYPTL